MSSNLQQPLSEILPDDVIDFIMSGLNMFDLVKLGNINKYYYNKSEKNEYWEIFYEKLFDRTYIDKQSEHIGDVTWATCKVGEYPGWNRIYNPINNDGQKCRIRSHYTSLSHIKSKIKYKNYKKMVMKRYRTLVLSDSYIKTEPNDITQLKYWTHKKKVATDQVNFY